MNLKGQNLNLWVLEKVALKEMRFCKNMARQKLLHMLNGSSRSNARLILEGKMNKLTARGRPYRMRIYDVKERT